jgi:mannose/fructose/N-acetylgalactosamine-specific phosphotransferase system component IIB
MDNDNSCDSFVCPFCGDSGASIIQDAVLKDDFKEILCSCTKCQEMYIRKYQFQETIKLIRTPLDKKMVLCFECKQPIHVTNMGGIMKIDDKECYFYTNCLKKRIDIKEKETQK